jgi:hypothetical protein
MGEHRSGREDGQARRALGKARASERERPRARPGDVRARERANGLPFDCRQRPRPPPREAELWRWRAAKREVEAGWRAHAGWWPRERGQGMGEGGAEKGKGARPGYDGRPPSVSVPLSLSFPRSARTPPPGAVSKKPSARSRPRPAGRPPRISADRARVEAPCGALRAALAHRPPERAGRTHLERTDARALAFSGGGQSAGCEVFVGVCWV